MVAFLAKRLSNPDHGAMIGMRTKPSWLAAWIIEPIHSQ